MCGITGFTWADKDLLTKMTEAIKYRGPDDSGYYIDENISLGHRRLSIIDLSMAGHQPMSNEDGSVVIVFNGEIYNYVAIKEDLIQNHSFKSNTDTEVLIHGYEEWGIDELLKKINGMFAFAIWDARTRLLILVRDRFGVKPLYYCIYHDQLLFASEIKSLLQFTEIKKEIDTHSLNSLFAYKFITGSKTIIRGIKKILPGHYLIKRNGTISIKKYWDLVWDKSPILDDSYYVKKFKDLFTAAVERRLMADVPLGVYLSGGLDSSAVVAVNSKLRADAVKTFTVAFNDSSDETKYARLIADHFHCDYHECVIDQQQMTKDFKNIVWFMDEPCADLTCFPLYYLSQYSKNYVTVVTSGEGADELFAGYPYNQIYSPLLKMIPGMIKNKVVSWYYPPFKNKQRKHLLKNNYNEINLLDQYLRLNSPQSLLNRFLYFDIKNELPNWQLPRTDRMTMAFGQEARVPFLDYKLAEFSTSLPDYMKIRNFTGKYVLRQAFKEDLPSVILKRRKQGFTIPFFNWSKQDLFPNYEDLLSPANIRDGPLNPDYVAKIIRKFKSLENPRPFVYYPYQIILLLVFEEWRDQYIR